MTDILMDGRKRATFCIEMKSEGSLGPKILVGI
jgi:hypothetical protein